MCTMVSTLVSGRTLHDFARGLRLEHYLALSAEEQWSMRSMSGYAGGMLADAFEALLGALFMDRGYPAARAFVLRLIEVRPSPAPSFSLLFINKKTLFLPIEARCVCRQAAAKGCQNLIPCWTRHIQARPQLVVGTALSILYRRGQICYLSGHSITIQCTVMHASSCTRLHCTT